MPTLNTTSESIPAQKETQTEAEAELFPAPKLIRLQAFGRDTPIELLYAAEMAPIAVGETIPNVTLNYLDDDNQAQKFNTHEELKGKKAVLIAVPGAFTPTCR